MNLTLLALPKAKRTKKYEFGSKVSFAVIPGQNIIVGVVNFQGNPHDSVTLEPTLEHTQKNDRKELYQRNMRQRLPRQKEGRSDQCNHTWQFSR